MPDAPLQVAALLLTAWLFGGMLLFAAAFAAFLFKALPASEARRLIRQAFPPFYLFVAGAASLGAAFCWPLDRGSAWVLTAIALTTVPTRQWLMPAINEASDLGHRQRFGWLHGCSVLVTLIHIAATAVVLVRLSG